MVSPGSSIIRFRVHVVPNFATKLGDNCIQILQLGRYIVGYTVANLVLRRSTSGAISDSLSQKDILSQIFDVIQSDVALQN